MPNYCNNKLTIKGEEAEVNRLLDFIKSHENDFDFNRVIPMPNSIRNTERGSVSFASEAACLFLKDKTITNHMKWMMDRLHLSIAELEGQIKKWIDEKKIDLELGQRIINNRLNHDGCGDWYEWSIENWGTKWQAINTITNNNVIEFETAWSPCSPVIEALAKKFANLEFEYKYFEPGVCLAGIETFLTDGSYDIRVYDHGELEYQLLAEEFGFSCQKNNTH